MTAFTEGDLQITIPDELDARTFDDESHGLSHCMKAVDFIVELPDRYYFLEFKDPENPKARPENRQESIDNFLSGKIDEDLKYKSRDSFLYEWASGKADKPVHFLVLIAIEDLDAAVLLQRTDALGQKLPLNGPSSGTWTGKIADSCAVFNIAAWNRSLTQFPVKRLPVRAE